MGSWNGTCALTNLPIIQGEPVVCYVLHLNSGHWNADVGGGFFEAHSPALTRGLPLRGIYNDYGGIGALRGPGLPWWKTRLQELRGGMMGPEAQALESDTLDDLQTFLDEVVRGEVYSGPSTMVDSDEYEPSSRFALMLMHEAAYARFVETMRDGDGWMLEPGATDAANMYKTRFLKYAKKFDVYEDGDNLRYIFNQEETLNSIFTHPTFSADDAVIDELVGMHLFDLALGCSRKSWNRQNGAGSGNSDASLQLAMAEFTVDYVKTQNAS